MQELNINGLWAGKQAAKGAPAVLLDRRLQQPGGGDLTLARDEGTAPFSDLSKYGDAADWINNVLGNGNPGLHAIPNDLAWLLYIYHGAETVTPVVGPPAKSRHQTKPTSGRGFFTSWLKRQGLSLITRQQFNDVLISQLEISGSTGQKDVRVVPTLLSLDPAVFKNADPAAVLGEVPPLLYTDGESSFEIDGVVFRGHSAFTLTLNEDLSPVYGDAPRPHDLVSGTPTVGVSVTFYLDADGQAQLFAMTYGDPTPAVDAKPLDGVPALGSYAFNLEAKDPSTGLATGDAFDLDVPGMKWTLPTPPGPNTGGGAAEVTMTGAMRPVAAADPYTIGVVCDDPAYA